MTSLKKYIPPETKEYPYTIDANECWVGCGTNNGNGYRRIWFRDLAGKKTGAQAHRLFYEMVNGKIPEGLVIDHLCRNPGCVNPEHLEAVTEKENTLRGEGTSAVNARKTRCKRGHKFTHTNPDGMRVCGVCGRARAVRRWAEILDQRSRDTRDAEIAKAVGDA